MEFQRIPGFVKLGSVPLSSAIGRGPQMSQTSPMSHHPASFGDVRWVLSKVGPDLGVALVPRFFWRKKTCHHTGNVDNIYGLQKNPWRSPKLPKAASATPFRVDYHMGRRLHIYLQNRKIFDCSSMCGCRPRKNAINQSPASLNYKLSNWNVRV